jgi:transposase
MWAYSLDLRRRVVQAYDERLETRSEIAERFGVSLSFITKLLRRRRETGSVAAKRHTGGRPGSLDEQGLETLRVLVRQQPDATLEELQERLWQQGCGSPSRSAVGRYVQALHLPRKKSRSRPANEIRPGYSG